MTAVMNLLHFVLREVDCSEIKECLIFWRVLEGMLGVPGPQLQDPPHTGLACSFFLSLCNKPDADTKHATDWR